MIAVNDLWNEIYPYLATQVVELYGRVEGQVLELGPFAGGITHSLAVSHPHMDFTIADDHSDYLAYVKHKAALQNLNNRMHFVNTALDKLPLDTDRFDLVLFRGAFFFIMNHPHILQEVYRVLASGGVAFVGGGYGKNTPEKTIHTIADESRVLNDKLGRQHVTPTQLRALLHSQKLEHACHIIEEGGLWLIIHKRPTPNEKQTFSLTEAFGLGQFENIALVGGGGKTSVMFRLAHELTSAGKKVISTTTTHIITPTEKETPCLIVESDEDVLIQRLIQALSVHKHVTLALAQDNDNKLKGLSPEMLDQIQALNVADYVINEADGAGCKPIKAPRHGEPIIPTTTTLVVALVGLDALDTPISTETAFRVEYIKRLTGLSHGGAMNNEVIATLLTHPHGIIQNAPSGARIIPFLNKTDIVPSETVAPLVSAVFARQHTQIKQVVAGSLLVYPPLYRTFYC